jgi:cerevisin
MRVKLFFAVAFVAHSVSALLVPDMTGTAVPEQYIVVFKDHVSDSQMASHWSWIQSTLPSPQLRVQGGNAEDFVLGGDYEGYGIKRQYNFNGFKGYAAKLPREAIKDVESHPDVDYVEVDRVMSILDSQKAPASWGLKRISTRDLPLTSSYVYPDSAGEGVNAYIVDTGIHIHHPEFEGRAKIGKTFVKDDDKDGNGHGSHVAGTIGSKSYGVAKKVTLIAVKVLDGRGYGDTSGVIAGIEFVATEGPKSKRKAVANMSLGGPSSKALDRAVQSAVKAGVVFVVAAGNSAGDACKLSPAGVAEAITVAASDKFDKIASFSETGKCVDIIAPGVDITSTWNDGRYNTISGTSMASPHVAGVVALALAEGNFSSPKEVQDYLKTISSKNKITGNLRATPNNFLYNNVTRGARPDDEPVEPKPTPEDPNDPGEPGGECPFPQCLFDPNCTSCCIDCYFK